MRLIRSTVNMTGCQARWSPSSNRSIAGRPCAWPTLRCGRKRPQVGRGASPSQQTDHNVRYNATRGSSGSGLSQTV